MKSRGKLKLGSAWEREDKNLSSLQNKPTYTLFQTNRHSIPIIGNTRESTTSLSRYRCFAQHELVTSMFLCLSKVSMTNKCNFQCHKDAIRTRISRCVKLVKLYFFTNQFHVFKSVYITEVVFNLKLFYRSCFYIITEVVLSH